MVGNVRVDDIVQIEVPGYLNGKSKVTEIFIENGDIYISVSSLGGRHMVATLRLGRVQIREDVETFDIDS